MVVVEVVVASGVGNIIGVTFVVSSIVLVTLVSSIATEISLKFIPGDPMVVLDAVLISGNSMAFVDDLVDVIASVSVVLEMDPVEPSSVFSVLEVISINGTKVEVVDFVVTSETGCMS